MFHRPELYTLLLDRIESQRKFIQVLIGPRQVGKTTLVQQVAQAIKTPAHYVSADGPTLREHAWLTSQWEVARGLAVENGKALLIIDEIQKVENWSESVKQLWDVDSREGVQLQVVLLGSSALLMQTGLSESLTGRFEVIRVPHWSFAEMQEAFGYGLDEFIFYGGYPGAAELNKDHSRWVSYMQDSLIETTVSRDILLLQRVDKPALLRRLLLLGCEYSGQILSYQKMVGQLQTVGNTTTLAHYLELLSGAGMLTGLQKYSKAAVRRRNSSPKLLALDTGLISALSGKTFIEAVEDRSFWGRLVESAVGAHLYAGSNGVNAELCYWRSRGLEVDYVLRAGEHCVAIEAKSGRKRDALSGLSAFEREYASDRSLLVGSDGIPIADFLLSPFSRWLSL